MLERQTLSLLSSAIAGVPLIDVCRTLIGPGRPHRIFSPLIGTIRWLFAVCALYRPFCAVDVKQALLRVRRVWRFVPILFQSVACEVKA